MLKKCRLIGDGLSVEDGDDELNERRASTTCPVEINPS